MNKRIALSDVWLLVVAAIAAFAVPIAAALRDSDARYPALALVAIVAVTSVVFLYRSRPESGSE